VSGRGGTFAAVLATLAFFVALDAVLAYIMWGVVLGMRDIEWLPLFPLWVVAVVVAAAFAARLMRKHRAAVLRTALGCAMLSALFLYVAAGVGVIACGEGGGCRIMRTR
jgi:hypothetical protein